MLNIFADSSEIEWDVIEKRYNMIWRWMKMIVYDVVSINEWVTNMILMIRSVNDWCCSDNWFELNDNKNQK